MTEDTGNPYEEEIHHIAMLVLCERLWKLTLATALQSLIGAIVDGSIVFSLAPSTPILACTALTLEFSN